MNIFSYYLQQSHLLSPHQALVVHLFIGHHEPVSLDHALATFERDQLQVDQRKLQAALDYFVSKGCLTKTADGQYLKLAPQHVLTTL